MRRKKHLGAILIGSCIMAVAGCSGADTGRPVFEIEESPAQAYEMVSVERGTVLKTGIMSVSYMQTVTEKESFGVSGKSIAHCYAEVGDTVTKGQVLAELDMESEKEELAELSYSIQTKSLQVLQKMEQRELQEKFLKAKKGKVSSSEYAVLQAEFEQEYIRKVEDLEDEIQILKMQYDALFKTVESGRIVAGMDGVVKMSNYTRGYVSVSNAVFMSLTDMDTCAFQGISTDLTGYLKVGDEVVFTTTLDEKEYVTTLTNINEATCTYTFMPKEQDFSITMGTMALATIVKDKKDNVLYVPRSAVHQAGDKYFVYYIDENDARRICEITVGLIGDSLTEVVSGLSEGQEIILQ